MRKAAEPRQGRGNYDSPFKSQFPVYKPAVGNNHVRILPPTWANPEHYSYSVFMHSYIGPDEGTYVCMRKMFGKACAACEEHQAARQSGDDDAAKRYAPKERFVCWILDRKGEEKLTPQLWPMSGQQDTEIATLTVDPVTGELLFVDHPDEGYDLTFTRTGQRVNTRYSAFRFDRRTSPILPNPKNVAEVLAFITENPISSVLNLYEPEHLRKILYGEVEEADPELDDASNGEEEPEAVDEEQPEGEVVAVDDESGSEEDGEYYDATESDEGEEQPEGEEEYVEEEEVVEEEEPAPEPEVRAPRRQQPRSTATRTVRADEVTRAAPRPQARPTQTRAAVAPRRQSPRGGGDSRYNK